MKKKTIIFLGLALFAGLFTACKDDVPDNQSVIINKVTKPTPLDNWLKENYVETYNINFKWRYEDGEGDMNYFTIPARYEDAVKMAKLIKFLCLEAYDEAGGKDFTRAVFPKLLYCIGEFQYKNNGTMILGTAENGKKIIMTGSNLISNFENDIDKLNTYYFKTIHHEFTHIMNQTKDYPASLKTITGTGYVGDSWSTEPYIREDYYLQHGFVSDYSQHSDVEDIAEMLSIYVVTSSENWNAMLEKAGKEGAELLTTKMNIVKDYMVKSFNIDLDNLRQIVQRRQAEVKAGRIDLSDLSK